MEKTKKNYSVIAGCLFILYLLCNIAQRGVLRLFSPFFLIFTVSVLALGIMLLLKRNNAIIPISLGIIALVKFYWLIGELRYLFEYFYLFQLLISICSLLTLISHIFLLFLSIMPYKKTPFDIGKLWFIPAVLEFLSLVYWLFVGVRIPSIILQALYPAGVVFAGLYFSQGIQPGEQTAHNTSDNTKSISANGYCDMTKHILLLVFLGGIWLYVWIYRITDYLNKTPNEEKRNPVTKLLLCMFVPFYYLYWIYQSARRIEILAKEKNIESDIVTLSVILALFVGIVPPIIMQSKLNQVCTCDYQNSSVQTASSTVQDMSQKVETDSDKTQEIRNYKKLLDDGIITEEEFEAKKKQLLGL